MDRIDHGRRFVDPKLAVFATIVLLSLVRLPLSGQPVSMAVEETFATTGSGQKFGPFTYVTWMTDAPGDEIWVADSHAENIVALSEAGEQIRMVATSGPGPGQVNAPMMMARVPGDGVVVYDSEHLALELFGPDGAFRERISLSENLVFPKGIVALSDGRFVVSGGHLTREHSVFLITRDGEWQEGFLPRREAETGTRIARRAAIQLAGGALTVDAAGRIIFSKASPHRILRLDPETGERELLAEDEDLLAYPGRDFYEETASGAWDPWFEYPRSVFVGQLPDGRILNVVRFEERGESLFQLYASDGTLVDSLRTDRSYTPYAVTEDGRLLASYQRPETGEHVATALEIRY